MPEAEGAGKKPAVLFIHNLHLEPNGEDSACESDAELLRSRGHRVEILIRRNADGAALPAWKTAASALWSAGAAAEVTSRIRGFRPDIAHFHNNFHRVSPSEYRACHSAGLPIVQTLHNFRPFCVNGLLYREGRPCEACVGKPFAWRGVRHACYRGSRIDSGFVLAVQAAQRSAGNLSGITDAFVALTPFARDVFIRGGLDPMRVHVKPNTASDMGCGGHKGGFFLYAGRLSEEKGVAVLLEAWRLLDGSIPLKIAGAGPSAPKRVPAGVDLLGQVGPAAIRELMREASALIIPSLCYEGFPMTLAEAFSAGLPVIASRIGALATIFQDERFGWLAPAGDAAALARVVRLVWNDPEGLARKGAVARREHEGGYGPGENYHALLGVYASAAAVRAARG